MWKRYSSSHVIKTQDFINTKMLVTYLYLFLYMSFCNIKFVQILIRKQSLWSTCQVYCNQILKCKIVCKLLFCCYYTHTHVTTFWKSIVGATCFINVEFLSSNYPRTYTVQWTLRCYNKVTWLTLIRHLPKKKKKY